MKPTAAANFHNDAATGTITAIPATGVDTTQHYVTYRQPRNGNGPAETTKTDTPKRRRNNRRAGKKQPVSYSIGTGGNAQRPIPTGPGHYTIPATGNPVRHFTYNEWQNFYDRALACGIAADKLALIQRTMIGRLDTHDVNRQKLTIRIDFLTKSDWRQYDTPNRNPNKPPRNKKKTTKNTITPITKTTPTIPNRTR